MAAMKTVTGGGPEAREVIAGPGRIPGESLERPSGTEHRRAHEEARIEVNPFGD